jgi:hemolysin D
MPELIRSNPNVPTIDFLDDWEPSTQELLDTLPQRWSRSLIYAMVAFSSIALPWIFFAKVDEVGNAKGRLEPKGKTIRLDSAISGKVAAVKVKEGETVAAGQPIVELNTDLIRTELQQAQSRLEGAVNRLTQLQLAKRQLQMSLSTQRLQYQAQLLEQQTERDRTKQRLSFYETASQLSQTMLQKDASRADRFRKFREMGIISGVQAEDAERAMLETRQKLEQTQADWRQGEIELQKQNTTLEKLRREGEVALIATQRQVEESQGEIVQLQSEINALRNQIKSLDLQLQQSTLTVPVSGTIFELPVQNAGAVVQPGQMLATIAPEGVPLVLRAQISNQDSGFLKVGQSVKIKLDAYPYQDYGIINGTVRWISPDSRQLAGAQPNQAGQEVYDLEIELSQSYVKVGDRQRPLNPGQTANAEIIIRQRRVVDFFLDPFRRLKEGGMNF